MKRDEVLRLKLPAPLDRVTGALAAVQEGASLNAQVEYGRGGFLVITDVVPELGLDDAK